MESRGPRLQAVQGLAARRGVLPQRDPRLLAVALAQPTEVLGERGVC